MNRNCLSFVILILLFLSPVIAGLGSEGTDEERNNFDPQSFDWKDGDYSKVSSWDGVSPSLIVRWVDVPDSAFAGMDWSTGQEKVPPEKEHLIPPEKVDVTKVLDQSKLTQEQLGFGDNLDKVVDWSKLDSVARDSVVSEKVGKSVKIDDGGKPVKGRVENGKVFIDQGFSVTYDNDFGVYGFKNVEITSNGLRVESGLNITLVQKSPKNESKVYKEKSLLRLSWDWKKYFCQQG